MAGFAPLFTGQLFIVGEALPREDSREATGKSGEAGLPFALWYTNREYTPQILPNPGRIRDAYFLAGRHARPPMVRGGDNRQGAADSTGSFIP